tara:strand:- start:6841 stop:7041 length:201 start_codon:yes stop_codon:yes gene_type:complete
MDNHESRHETTARLIQEWDALNRASQVAPTLTRSQKVRAFAGRFGWLAIAFPPLMVAVFIWVHAEA